MFKKTTEKAIADLQIKIDKEKAQTAKIEKQISEMEDTKIIVMAEAIFMDLTIQHPRGNPNRLSKRAFSLARAFSRQKSWFYQIRDLSRK
jgi:predicted  nucleic acid-binding Zn-ribbon protein